MLKKKYNILPKNIYILFLRWWKVCFVSIQYFYFENTLMLSKKRFTNTLNVALVRLSCGLVFLPPFMSHEIANLGNSFPQIIHFISSSGWSMSSKYHSFSVYVLDCIMLLCLSAYPCSNNSKVRHTRCGRKFFLHMFDIENSAVELTKYWRKNSSCFLLCDSM